MNTWQQFINMMYELGQYPEPEKLGKFVDQQQKELCKLLIDEEVNNELFKHFDEIEGLELTPLQLSHILDDIVDSIWVLIWLARSLGVTDLHPFFAEVGRANLAKIPDTGPIKHPVTGKLQKPPGWKKPDMFKLTEKLYE